MRCFMIFVAIAILLMPAVHPASLTVIPPAAASHGLVHDSAVDDSARRTAEPDNEVLRCTGCALDGRANRVTAPGRSPGDGSLFLDMRLGSRVGPETGPGFDVYAGSVLSPVTDGRALLLPGVIHATAWYGQWQDLDGDGIIDDIHDSDVAGAADEFRWRGVATGEAVAMTYYVNPYPFFVVHGAGYSRSLDENIMDDHTGLSNPAQEWSDKYAAAHVDGGFLGDIQVLTVAGAPRITGGPLDYDVDHPDALVDVDAYEAVSPEIGALWLSTAVAARGTYLEALAMGLGSYDTAMGIVNPILDEHVDPTVDEAYDVATDPALAFDRLAPKDKREPNTWEDDFEGRALFGGVGDVAGSHNQYPGHRDGFHMWFDARPTFIACGGAWVGASGTAVAANAPLCHRRGLDPVAAAMADEGSTATVVSFNADIFLWHDKNGDGMAGPACNPSDPNEFDAERNVCHDRFHRVDAYPFYGNNKEKVSACAVASARGGILTVTPLGGEWPVGTVLVPDFKQTTRPVLENSLRLLTGTDPAPVRWEDTCDGTSDLLSRDAIVFPTTAAATSLRTVTSATITSFVDKGLGIEIGRESVTDVDVIPSLL